MQKLVRRYKPNEKNIIHSYLNKEIIEAQTDVRIVSDLHAYFEKANLERRIGVKCRCGLTDETIQLIRSAKEGEFCFGSMSFSHLLS